MLGWPAYRLAQRSRIAVAKMAKAEQSENRPDLKDSTLVRMKAVLEAAGIEFSIEDNGGAGVRLR